MSYNIKNDPTEAVGFEGGSGQDFNRTVAIATPNVTMASGARRPVPEQKSSSQNGELEDFVKGVSINPYISSILDMSSNLNGELDNIKESYALLEEFADGGTASVFSARDRKLSRLVAVKSLKMTDGDNTEMVEAFVAEAKVTAQLDHPGIIPIYGLYTDDKNGIHLIMKLVNGKTLREYLRNIVLNYRTRGMGEFDEDVMLRKRLEIFLHVCDTIAYAHHRNVIHRDLKPENIMIGKYMEVYVMDWGLAKVIDEEGDNMVKLSGTPRYFPPEVLRRQGLDLRSDIFTLGLILQEVVTLQPAVPGNDEKEYMANILQENLEPVAHLFGRSVDADLQAIILKATAYNMEERYQTVDAFAEDLRRYMGGLSIAARPGGFFSRILRSIFG
ncbi:MAG: serine/threonine protein kinase [Victivallales bacterium]|nr:serine/threonine protein kinase [Victivallales bacterium]